MINCTSAGGNSPGLGPKVRPSKPHLPAKDMMHDAFWTEESEILAYLYNVCNCNKHSGKDCACKAKLLTNLLGGPVPLSGGATRKAGGPVSMLKRPCCYKNVYLVWPI